MGLSLPTDHVWLQVTNIFLQQPTTQRLFLKASDAELMQ